MKRKFTLFVSTLLLLVILGISFSSPMWQHTHTAGDHPHQHGHGIDPDHGHSHTHSHGHGHTHTHSSHSHSHGSSHSHSHAEDKPEILQEHAHFSLFGYVFTISLPSRSETPRIATRVRTAGISSKTSSASTIAHSTSSTVIPLFESQDYLSWSVLLKFDLLPLNARLHSPELSRNGQLNSKETQLKLRTQDAPPTPPPKMIDLSFSV